MVANTAEMASAELIPGALGAVGGAGGPPAMGGCGGGGRLSG